jgi:large subunit ribosomal protein L12
MSEEKKDAPEASKDASESKIKKPNLVYAALLLHSAGKEVNEASVKKIADAAELGVDETQIKALVAALDGVDIEEAIANAVTTSVAAAPETKEDAKEEKKEEESEEEKEKKAEEAAEGLGALFG